MATTNKAAKNVYLREGFIARLTKKAEPPPTRGVDCNRSGNGGWLRRLVRRLGLDNHLEREKCLTTAALTPPTAAANVPPNNCATGHIEAPPPGYGTKY